MCVMLRLQMFIVSTVNDVSLWQVPADGCYGRRNDYYKSGKQNVCFTELQSIYFVSIIIIITIMTFIKSTALSKIRCAACTCHSVLTER